MRHWLSLSPRRAGNWLLIAGIGTAVVDSLLALAAGFVPVAPWGWFQPFTWLALNLVYVISMVAGVAFVAAALLALLLALFSSRLGAYRYLMTAALGTGVALLLGLVGATVWGGSLRDRAIEAWLSRSEGLVEAIDRFEAEQGRPPKTLGTLVPKYLAAVPTTGLGGYSQYEYVSGSDAETAYANPWILRVRVPEGLVSPFYVYFPNQNYGKRVDGYPVGEVRHRWALVCQD